MKFPDDYPEPKLAGKDAVFAVKVKEVAKAIKPEINDEFAKTLGAETLAKLRELVTAKIAGEYLSITRQKLKRQILDALDKSHDFALPETLVESEFETIWRQVTQGLDQAGKTCGRGQSEDDMRPNTAGSRNGGCASASSSARSTRPKFRWARTSCAGR